jgi:hypothetical protein
LPAVQFLFVVVVVVCATSVLASALPSDRARGRLGYGCVVLVAGVMSWAVGSQLWGQVQGLAERQESGSALPKAEAAVAGGSSLGLNTEFLKWAKDQIAPDERFYVMPNGPAADAAVYQWTTYQLFPRVSVGSPDEADVLVFYKVDPATVRWDRAAFKWPAVLTPGFAVAHRRALQ